jgi:hypothetical protein
MVYNGNPLLDLRSLGLMGTSYDKFIPVVICIRIVHDRLAYFKDY